MSAQIPSTMLLSDLLKSTGYDCPEELQGRTFEEATAGGDVQTNKASTIDVSAYTEPIVIKPDTDYESMKKNTVTLSNIPQTKTEVALNATENTTYTPEEGEVYNSVTVNVPVGVTKLYSWINSSNNAVIYTLSETPEVNDIAYYAGKVGGYSRLSHASVSEVSSATTIKAVLTGGGNEYAGVRDSNYDFTF